MAEVATVPPTQSSQRDDAYSKATVTSADSGKYVPLPDPMKLARDIRDQLKGAEISVPLKSEVSNAMKDVEALLNFFKEVGPYLRHPLVKLRQAVKRKVKKNDAEVTKQLAEFKERVERVKAKKHQIKELKESKKNQPEMKLKLFQIYIDENIRIVIIDKLTDINAKMGDAKKLKKLVNEVDRLLSVASFSTKIKTDVRDTLQLISNMLALDGTLAIKMKPETVNLKNAVLKGKTAEEEIEKVLKNMKPKVIKLTRECEDKRDDSEKAMREVNKIMLNMDEEINDIIKKREKAREKESGVNRGKGEFWVPPTLTEQVQQSKIFREIDLENQDYRKPRIVYDQQGDEEWLPLPPE